MNERILDKIAAIEHALERISEILPTTFGEYKRNETTRAACERYFEMVVEGVVDLAFLIVKEKKLEMPEGDIEVIQCLARAGIIDAPLSERLQDAKRMRNIIIHLYGEIDDEKVYCALSEELEKDVRSFLTYVQKDFNRNKEKNDESQT